MKKIISVLLILILASSNYAFASRYLDNQLDASKKNKKYSGVKKYTWQMNEEQTAEIKTLNIKDPKLIDLKVTKTISDNQYNKKIKQDENIYKNKILPTFKKKTNSINVDPLPVDFYNMYRISEKIIRANNLDYVNWRVAVRKTAVDYNAQTTAANLVIINTALYDSLYSNDDALAYVVAHEMAHQVLGHLQQLTDMQHRNKKIQWLLFPIMLVGVHPEYITDLMESKESRKFEFIADSFSIELITRAGYDVEKAMEAVNIMNAQPNKETLYSTHPNPKKRIKNLKETQKYLSPYLKEEGKINIYNSNVLDCKKSSDRVSFVIFQSEEKEKKDFYKAETPEELLLRIAYTDYKNGNMKEANKVFRKLTKISESYIPYLYMSYANEYLYKQQKQEKYLNRAIKCAEKAQEIDVNNKYVEKQIKDLTEDL